VVAPAKQSLRDNLERVMAEYVAARTGGQFGKTHELWSVFTELKKAFRLLGPVEANPNIRVKASVGQGNWTKVPWIALLDERETDTTQKGVYVVLLFRQDMSGVYLTLAQGVTEPQKQFGAKDARAFLHRRSAEVRTYIQDLAAYGFALDDGIDLKADPGLGADYADSVIAYKLYEKGSVPDDETVESDVAALLQAHGRYLDRRSVEPETSRTWIFQANPAYYDLAGALRTLGKQTWLVRLHTFFGFTNSSSSTRLTTVREPDLYLARRPLWSQRRRVQCETPTNWAARSTVRKLSVLPFLVSILGNPSFFVIHEIVS
jgi:hypothetical protein